MRPLLPLLLPRPARVLRGAEPGRRPGDACQKATAKALSACVEKASAAAGRVLPEDGRRLPGGDKKLVEALDGDRQGDPRQVRGRDRGGRRRLRAPRSDGPRRALRGGVRARGRRHLAARLRRRRRARSSRGAERRTTPSACSPPARRRASCWRRSLGAVGKCAGKALRRGRPRQEPTRSTRSSRRGTRQEARRRSAPISRAWSASTRPHSSPRRAHAPSARRPRPATRSTPTTACFPFPNDYFRVGDVTLADRPTARPRRAGAARERRSERAHVDPAKWNVARRLQRRPGADRSRRRALDLTHVRRAADHRPRARPSMPDAPVLLLDTVTRRAAAPARRSATSAGRRRRSRRSSRASARTS